MNDQKEGKHQEFLDTRQQPTGRFCRSVAEPTCTVIIIDERKRKVLQHQRFFS